MTQESDLLCEITDLQVHYPIRRGFFQRVVGHVRAAEDINLRLYRGETLALVGESGCGKSTLGRAILGLEKPTAGHTRFQPFGQERNENNGRRSRLAQVVFQDPLASLDPRWSVLNIVAEGLDVHRLVRRGERRDRVVELLSEVGLSADFLHKYPHQLSGGQQQRVAIARALATRPELIVLDEATSALDVSVQAQILNLLLDLRSELGLTYLFISHDLAVVGQFADRVAVMYLGRIMESGPVAQVLQSPAHPYTQALLSSVLLVKTGSNILDRPVVVGDVPSPSDPPSGCRFRTRCQYARPSCAAATYQLNEASPDHLAAGCVEMEERSLSAKRKATPSDNGSVDKPTKRANDDIAGSD